jgi:hypothetical protein
VPKASVADSTLDLADRQEVEEAALLVTRDEEGLPLPELTEEALGFDR